MELYQEKPELEIKGKKEGAKEEPKNLLTQQQQQKKWEAPLDHESLIP